jgi:hypothetical protein
MNNRDPPTKGVYPSAHVMTADKHTVMPDCLQTHSHAWLPRHKIMPDCIDTVIPDCLQTHNHAWLPTDSHAWLPSHVWLPSDIQSCLTAYRHNHVWLSSDTQPCLTAYRHSHADCLDTVIPDCLQIVMPDYLQTQLCLKTYIHTVMPDCRQTHHSHVRLPRHTVMVDCLQTHSHLQSIIIFFSAIKMIKPSKYQYNILLVL